jgi:hypothetical protein
MAVSSETVRMGLDADWREERDGEGYLFVSLSFEVH